jgi:ABC-type transport system involved in cytochrome c biogenesis ATPase subunit
VLDEPGSNLDAPGRPLLLQLLQAHLSAGGAAVVATHQGSTCRPRSCAS